MAKNKKIKGTESYSIKFWIQKPDGFWEQRTKIYGGFENKDDHNKAEACWKEEFRKEKVKLVSVSYQ